MGGGSDFENQEMAIGETLREYVEMGVWGSRASSGAE